MGIVISIVLCTSYRKAEYDDNICVVGVFGKSHRSKGLMLNDVINTNKFQHIKVLVWAWLSSSLPTIHLCRPWFDFRSEALHVDRVFVLLETLRLYVCLIRITVTIHFQFHIVFVV